MARYSTASVEIYREADPITTHSAASLHRLQCQIAHTISESTTLSRRQAPRRANTVMFFPRDVSNGFRLLGITSGDCCVVFLLKLQRKESAHIQFPIADQLRF